jgi:long-subunit acyl-CoA synthetase (AMP-forming)
MSSALPLRQSRSLKRTDNSGINVSHWLRVGTNCPTWALDFDALVDRAPADPLVVRTDGSDPVFITYTSGTTGLPKGAIHTHDSFQWSVLTTLASVDVRYRDRYLISLPLFHVGALSPMACCIYRGTTIVLLNQFHPGLIWDVFRDEKVTTTLAVPAMLNVMLTTWIMSGAGPVPPSLIEAYARWGLEVHQVYGLTESGGQACVISPEVAMSRIGSTGKSFFHTDVRIVDKHGADCEPGVPGEVLARGRRIMAGYWNRPRPTRKRSSTAGCTQVTWQSRTPTASYTSRTGSRT